MTLLFRFDSSRLTSFYAQPLEWITAVNNYSDITLPFKTASQFILRTMRVTSSCLLASSSLPGVYLRTTPSVTLLFPKVLLMVFTNVPNHM